MRGLLFAELRQISFLKGTLKTFGEEMFSPRSVLSCDDPVYPCGGTVAYAIESPRISGLLRFIPWKYSFFN